MKLQVEVVEQLPLEQMELLQIMVETEVLEHLITLQEQQQLTLVVEVVELDQVVEVDVAELEVAVTVEMVQEQEQQAQLTLAVAVAEVVGLVQLKEQELQEVQES